MPDLEADTQFLRLVVEQQDGEDFVVDEALQHLGHALQQGVQVQRGIDRIGHLEQVAVKGRRNHWFWWGSSLRRNSTLMIAVRVVDIVGTGAFYAGFTRPGDGGCGRATQAIEFSTLQSDTIFDNNFIPASTLVRKP